MYREGELAIQLVVVLGVEGVDNNIKCIEWQAVDNDEDDYATTELYKRTSRRSSVAPAAAEAIAQAPAPVQEGVFARGCASWLDRCLGAAVLYRWNCGTSKITRLSFCHCAGVGEGVSG